MKKLVSFALMLAIIVVLFSCDLGHSKFYREVGIGRIINIDNKYSIIPFNSKTSSANLLFYMEREGYRCVKTTEMNYILSQLNIKQNRHAALYHSNEFSKSATSALQEIAVAMKDFKNPEEMCPIFHMNKGKIFGDYGDFSAGWSENGYLVVTAKKFNF